jgi:WhiB family redox-sensing transcriptional regulator
MRTVLCGFFATSPTRRRAVARSDREEGSQLVSDTRPTARRMNLVIAPSTVRPVEAEERIAWVSQALCRTTDPDELFVRGAAQRKAAVICRHCPVMQECAADALDNKVEFGVWGGMTERQRRALLKEHPDVADWSDYFDKRKRRGIS